MSQEEPEQRRRPINNNWQSTRSDLYDCQEEEKRISDAMQQQQQQQSSYPTNGGGVSGGGGGTVATGTTTNTTYAPTAASSPPRPPPQSTYHPPPPTATSAATTPSNVNDDTDNDKENWLWGFPKWIVLIATSTFGVLILIGAIGGVVARTMDGGSSSDKSSGSNYTIPAFQNRSIDNNSIKVPTVAPPPLSEVPTPTSTTTIGRSQNEIDMIVSAINAFTETGRTLVYYPVATTPSTTPMYVEEMALQWVIDQDPLQYNPNDQDGRFHIYQRYALVTLFATQFHITVYDMWTNSTGWLSNTDECSWHGITCTELDLGTEWGGIQNYITAVQLPENNIRGMFPVDFTLLNGITKLDLNGNILSGSLPTSIGAWTTMNFFNVAGNALTGTIPESIGTSWTMVQTVYLTYNAFIGSVPAGLCTVSTDLRTLVADCAAPEVSCNCCTCY